jgi:hypothetical protein
MPPVRPYRRKTKRRTTYNERYNALSALDVQTRDLIQGLWTQSAIELKNAQSLLVLSFVTNNFQLMGSCLVLAMLVNYMNTLEQCQFFESLDNRGVLDCRVICKLNKLRILCYKQLYNNVYLF